MRRRGPGVTDPGLKGVPALDPHPGQGPPALGPHSPSVQDRRAAARWHQVQGPGDHAGRLRSQGAARPGTVAGQPGGVAAAPVGGRIRAQVTVGKLAIAIQVGPGRSCFQRGEGRGRRRLLASAHRLGPVPRPMGEPPEPPARAGPRVLLGRPGAYNQPGPGPVPCQGRRRASGRSVAVLRRRKSSSTDDEATSRRPAQEAPPRPAARRTATTGRPNWCDGVQQGRLAPGTAGQQVPPGWPSPVNRNPEFPLEGGRGATPRAGGVRRRGEGSSSDEPRPPPRRHGRRQQRECLA